MAAPRRHAVARSCSRRPTPRRRGPERWRPPTERPLRPTRPGRITLVVADGREWWRDRTAPLRAVLADPTIPVRFVALTDDVHTLPAVCTTYVTFDGSGPATVDRLLHRTRIDAVLPNTVDLDLALETARALAPLDDPGVPRPAVTRCPNGCRSSTSSGSTSRPSSWCGIGGSRWRTTDTPGHNRHVY